MRRADFVAAGPPHVDARPPTWTSKPCDVPPATGLVCTALPNNIGHCATAAFFALAMLGWVERTRPVGNLSSIGVPGAHSVRPCVRDRGGAQLLTGRVWAATHPPWTPSFWRAPVERVRTRARVSADPPSAPRCGGRDAAAPRRATASAAALPPPSPPVAGQPRQADRAAGRVFSPCPAPHGANPWVASTGRGPAAAAAEPGLPRRRDGRRV